jgi:hypothetical protein
MKCIVCGTNSSLCLVCGTNSSLLHLIELLIHILLKYLVATKYFNNTWVNSSMSISIKWWRTWVSSSIRCSVEMSSTDYAFRTRCPWLPMSWFHRLFAFRTRYSMYCPATPVLSNTGVAGQHRGSLSLVWIKVPCISKLYPRVLFHFKPTQILRKSIKKFELTGNLKTNHQKTY